MNVLNATAAWMSILIKELSHPITGAIADTSPCPMVAESCWVLRESKRTWFAADNCVNAQAFYPMLLTVSHKFGVHFQL
jgi:hypothetical protein